MATTSMPWSIGRPRRHSGVTDRRRRHDDFVTVSAREAVADARVGADERGPPSGSIFAAQVGDVRAQRGHVVGVGRPPDLGEQRPVGEQAPAVADEQPQQVELDRRQVDVLAVAAHQVGGEVDLEPVGARSPARPARRRPGAAPPAGGRRARAGRTAWSRSRRRRPRARGSSASSSPTAERTRIGMSLHSRMAPADLDAVAVGEHEVEDGRVGTLQTAATSSASAAVSAGSASKPASRSTTRSARRICGSSSQTSTRSPLTALTSPGPCSAGAPARAGSSTTKLVPWPGQRLGPHLPAVGLDEALGDRQPEARAGGAAGSPGRGGRARRSARAPRAGCPGRGRRCGRAAAAGRRARAPRPAGRRRSAPRSRAGWRTARSSWTASARTSGRSASIDEREARRRLGSSALGGLAQDLLDRAPRRGAARPRPTAASRGRGACR